MVDIHIVEYQCNECSDLITFPIRAFKSKQKAEGFMDKCKKECERIDLELEKYWNKYKVEYYGLGVIVREFVMKHSRIDTKMKEFKRKNEIKDNERKIIASHKYHKDCLRKKDGNYYDINTIQLDENE